jgi:SNF2 family DNA or RNA helicase
MKSQDLKKYNIPYGVFSGDKKKKEKNQTIEDYNKGKLRTLLISPSGAEGLDLKGTTLEQILDPNWNPAKEQQVIGRGARFKSHIDLPLEKRKVEIERYSSTRRPNFFQKLIGKKPSTAIDQYIRHRANEKEQLTTQLNNLISSS